MAALKKVFSDRPFTGAVFYVVVLFLFEEWRFDFPQAKFFQLVMTFMSEKEVLIAFSSGITSFLFFCSFIWITLRSSRTFQVFYVTLFASASLVQYSYWKAVERFLISADLKIAAATPIHTWRGASVLFFNWYFLLPVVVLICFILLFSERQGWRPSLIRLGYIILSLTILATAHSLTKGPLNLGSSVPAFYQTISQSVIDSIISHQREIVDYHHPILPENNIVLVIDESIRGDHLSINGYRRETTPFLSMLADTEDGFHTFGLAVAGATCSYSSNGLILTGVRPGLDDFELTVTYPTLFQYAKAMGYKTYYIDAQTNSLWNGLTDQDLSFIDTWLKARDFGNDFQSDFRAADRIADIVSEGTGNFIVLNKRGVHFLYESSYPPEAVVWLPLPGDYTSHPELVSNPYDNGILYNLNTFFDRLLINTTILENTTILYTSDHGQTLFEEHATWLHCNNTAQEATVPLILIGRNLPPIADRPRFSHSNILPTLLDLMAVPPSQRLHSYSSLLFSGADDSIKDHYFFDGSLRLILFLNPETDPIDD